MQAVLRNLTFANVSNTPSASPRTVQVSLTDGDGGVSPNVSKTISVTPVNDAPQIVRFDGQAQYLVGGPAVLLDEDVQLQDVDHSSFANGRLTVSLVANVQSTDRLSIQSQGDGLDQIRVSGLQIFYQGVLIGTWSGTTRLTVLLNADASIAATQKLIRSITFSSLSASPSLLTRTVSMDSIRRHIGEWTGVDANSIELSRIPKWTGSVAKAANRFVTSSRLATAKELNQVVERSRVDLVK